MSRIITPENLEQLGFVDTSQALTFLDRGFRLNDQIAMRAVLNIAGWIVLSREFNIPKAVAPSVAASARSERRPDAGKRKNLQKDTHWFDGISCWFDQATSRVRLMF
jgi:hypothetical protein